MATLVGVPARWTAWHSVMPRAMPPATGGGPAAGSNLCRPELGVAAAGVAAGDSDPARSLAPEPTARSAGGAGSVVAGDGSAACAVAAAGTAQRPSALTMSSAPTGLWGPRLTPVVTGLAQSGFANMATGFENHPPSFCTRRISAEFLQPHTASAVAQASAIRKCAKSRDKAVDPADYLFVP